MKNKEVTQQVEAENRRPGPVPYRRLTDDVVEVIVKVSPRASVSQLNGILEVRDQTFGVKVQLTSVPEQGKANTELVRLLAKTWGVSKSRITIVSGKTSQLKTIHIQLENEAEVQQLCKGIHELPFKTK